MAFPHKGVQPEVCPTVSMKEHSPETKNLAFAVIHNKSQAHCDYCPAHCFSLEECVCVCVCIFTVSAVANPNAISDHHFQHVVVQEKASAHVFFIFSFLYFPFVFFIFFSFSMNNLSSLKTHFFPPLCIYLFVLVLRQTMFLLFKSNVLPLNFFFHWARDCNHAQHEGSRLPINFVFLPCPTD